MKCDVCEEAGTQVVLYATSGVRLDLCAVCAAKLMLGTPVVDVYGFEWTLNSTGSPSCVHAAQEVLIE